MTENAAGKSDERLAFGLLMDHLTSRGGTDFQCEINTDDPPDLIITWQNGERWGVEVTRVYQQVDQIGKPEVGSSASVVAFLLAFGDELEKETEGIRHRDYSLYLEGPGPFSSWKRSVSRQRWKKETKVLILSHIASGESRILRFAGGRLLPGIPGRPWRVSIGYPCAELESTTTQMLRCVLQNKTNDLPRWNGTFSQRWLLLLNCYPAVDDAAKVEGTLRQLVRDNAGLSGFDGVFWSGYPDRTLIPIAMPQRPGSAQPAPHRLRAGRADSHDRVDRHNDG